MTIRSFGAAALVACATLTTPALAADFSETLEQRLFRQVPGLAKPSDRLSHAPQVAPIRLPEPTREKDLFTGNARVDPALQSLAFQAGSKSPGDLKDLADSLAIPLAGPRVAVALAAASGRSSSDLARELYALGGQVTAEYGGTVYATLPVAALSELGGLQPLGYAAPQSLYVPSRIDKSDGRVVSEGVVSTQVDRLHAAGILGQGVKVGILDFGFQGYGQLQSQGAVPAAAATKAFNESGALENGNVHGAACAEIVHDMAPDAQIYLAVVDGREDQIVAAAQWLVAQGISILSFSGGGHGGGPHDGTALLDRLVDSVVREHGVLWINAAGNEGDSHWLGETVDRNGNGLVDNSARSDDALLLQTGGGPIQLVVNWDDWGKDPTLPAASQDIDAYLFAVDPQGKPTLVGRSENPQSGRQRPLEVIAGEAPAGIYALVLKATRIDRPVKVHIFASHAQLADANATGSIGIPATARQALSVGAVDVRNAQLESFSSQGPTDDGRIKPDLSAPDHNLSLAYSEGGGEPGRFPGTSAACPHVSGFAALLKSIEPRLDQPGLRNRVLTNVRPMTGPVPSNQFGAGHIDASRVQVDAGRAGQPPSEQSPPGPGSSPGRDPALDFLKPILERM